MKGIKFTITGLIFGIIMTKSEAISWCRIQEMFRFQSFHMYGIIGTAVVIGMVAVFLVKKFKLKDTQGKQIISMIKTKDGAGISLEDQFWSGLGANGSMSRANVRKYWIWLLGYGSCCVGRIDWNLPLRSNEKQTTSLKHRRETWIEGELEAIKAYKTTRQGDFSLSISHPHTKLLK